MIFGFPLVFRWFSMSSSEWEYGHSLVRQVKSVLVGFIFKLGLGKLSKLRCVRR